MTTPTTSHSKITLPLLIEYVDALLPSLDVQLSQTPEPANNATELLWVAHEKADLAALQIQLKHSMATTDTLTAEAWDTSTLSDLNRQPLLSRYELVCFWLPALSQEQIQQYVPLLMRYRDLYAAHLLIAIDDSINLQPYGFTPFDILSEPSLNIEDMAAITSSSASATLWQFNLYDYKQLPNWLNADYWANPENWGKHRW
ncbi:DUF6231 family protein [Psychrobacter sp. NG27]|uniref:DUF6231 family protein n=1 Tax=Psychrobacter sp. NG27 TaxID=2781966 RepID=UPI0018DEF8CB|nr:DUF6231 family protein [Psychrobacter sp. NG27]MBI0426310.1 hypothetical protein [Psychrobacter sp. NG27]